MVTKIPASDPGIFLFTVFGVNVAFRRLDKAVYGWRKQVATRSLVG